jgi:RNA polymerase sigma factor (sigma-70 family)
MSVSAHPRPRPRNAGPRRRERSSSSEHELVLAAQRDEPDAREHLIEAFMPLIATVARTYRNSTAAIERTELLQEGVAGLLTALRRFDPARGTPFWAYAAWWVRQAMQQLVAERSRPVVLSDRALRQLARIKDARAAHAREKGAWPTTAELAAATGLPWAQVDHLIAVERAPKTLAEHDAGENAGATPASRGEMLADPRAEDEYDRVLTRLECERVVRLLDGLDARERGILRARYGLDGREQTLREIARRLDLSAERVRQLEQHALEELRTAALA